MSKIARWSYKAVATVYPTIVNEWDGTRTYGEPFLISCAWERTDGTATDSNGNEVSNTLTIFTELLYNNQETKIPLRGDMIATGDTTDQPDPLLAGANEITGIVKWDMSMFNDTPDYKIVTGG